MGERTLVFDVEATGLAASDRVVSIAGVWCNGFEPTGEQFYFVFNPQKASHPAAAHGLADWRLRFQPPFAQHADGLSQAFARADLVVGHNVGFDLRMMNHEFATCGGFEILAPTYCTMQNFQARHQGERADLDSCVARMKMKRTGTAQSAYEDAFLAMNLYRWLGGCAERTTPPSPLPEPANAVGVPREVVWADEVDATPNGCSCPPAPEQVAAVLAQWEIVIAGHSPRTARMMLAAHDYAAMLVARTQPSQTREQMRALICALADADDFREPLLEWSRWSWGRLNPPVPRNALRHYAEELLASLVD